MIVFLGRNQEHGPENHDVLWCLFIFGSDKEGTVERKEEGLLLGVSRINAKLQPFRTCTILKDETTKHEREMGIRG